MGAWLATDRRRQVFAASAAVVALATIAYGLILRFAFFGDEAVTAIDDIGEGVAAAIAAAACVYAARRHTGRDRLGWALMGISAALWAAGEAVWSVYEVGMQIDVPYPSLADVGFLAAVPFAIAGIRSFWGAPRGTSAHWRIWFDGVIVALALVSTAWGFGLRDVWNSSADTRFIDLAYPISDIVTGTVLILAIRRASEHQKAQMALLLIGVACYSIADSAFAYLTAANNFGAVGSVLDTGWFTGYLLIGLAAIYPDGQPKTQVQQAPLDLWQLALPWMTLLTASAGDLYSALSGHELDVVQTSLTGILALLLTVNMILERREFLDMLIELEDAHNKLRHDFKRNLVEVRRFSAHIRDGRDLNIDQIRAMAGEIHRDAQRLDALLGDILEEDDTKDIRGIVAGGVKGEAGKVIAARSTGS